MMTWDSKSMSKRFESLALSAERYLNEIKPKIKGRPAYEHSVDEYLAKFYIYNSLHRTIYL